MLDVTAQLDCSIEIVVRAENEEEFVHHRRLVGRLVGEIFLDIVEPIYAEHPDLTPNEPRRS